MKNHLNTFLKSLKIGFKGRLIVCLILILSVGLYNFDNQFVRVGTAVATIVAAELFVFCYVPLYLNNLSLIFKTKTIDQPLPDELKELARAMGVKVKKMKIFPKALNAYARGNQLFIGQKLLEQLNSEQIKAVVAHEFGHMKERHAILQILYIIPIMLFVSLVWNGIPAAFMQIGLIAYMMVALIPIQWLIEARADRAAAKYVSKESIKEALLAIAEKHNLNEYSESHPSILNRIKWIDELNFEKEKMKT